MTSFFKYSCKHAIKRIVLHAMILLLRQGKTGQLNRKEEKMEIKEKKVGLNPKHTARQPHTLALFLLYNLAPLTTPNTSRSFSRRTDTSKKLFHISPQHTLFAAKKWTSFLVGITSNFFATRPFFSLLALVIYSCLSSIQIHLQITQRPTPSPWTRP